MGVRNTDDVCLKYVKRQGFLAGGTKLLGLIYEGVTLPRIVQRSRVLISGGRLHILRVLSALR